MVHQKPSTGIRRWLGTQKFSNTSVIDSQELRTSCEEGDFCYDEIGSVLKIKQLRNEKRELLEALEMYYKVLYLGEGLEALDEEEDK